MKTLAAILAILFLLFILAHIPSEQAVNQQAGPVVELDPGNVLEMWFASPSVYEKTIAIN